MSLCKTIWNIFLSVCLSPKESQVGISFYLSFSLCMVFPRPNFGHLLCSSCFFTSSCPMYCDSLFLFVCTSGGCWASTKTFLQLVPFLQNFWELEVKSEKLSPPLNTTILLPIYLPTYRSTFPATQVNEKLFEALNYILSNLNRIVFCIFQRQNLVKKWKAWLNRSM